MGDAEAEQGPPYSSAACGASRSRFAGARPVLGGLGSVMAMVQAQAPPEEPSSGVRWAP